MKRYRPSVVLLLVTFCCALALIGCRPVTPVAPPTPTYTPPARPTRPADTFPQRTATPTAAPTPAEDLAPPTASPSPQAASCPSGSEHKAAFVADLSLPDGSRLSPGSPQRKSWRLRNTGDCTWQPGVQLVFISGTRLSGATQATAPPAAPGTTVDLTIDFVTPTRPGSYRSYWRLQAVDGTLFGGVVYTIFCVTSRCQAPLAPTAPLAPAARTAEATATPPAVTEPTATPEVPGETAIPACRSPAPQFVRLWRQATDTGVNPGCAIADPSPVTGTVQAYWSNPRQEDSRQQTRSLLVWRADTDDVYVLRGLDNDTSQAQLFVHPATWSEEDAVIPPACQSQLPPEGYTMPARRFGAVWCAEGYEESVGWPRRPENAATLTIQETREGLLLHIDDSAGSAYLAALNFATQQATLMMEE